MRWDSYEPDTLDINHHRRIRLKEKVMVRDYTLSMIVHLGESNLFNGYYKKWKWAA